MGKALRRKMWRFAVAVACAAAVVVGAGLLGLSGFLTWGELAETNLKTLDLIPCVENERASFDGARLRCDISRIQNDVTFEPADYVLTREGGAMVWARMNYPRLWINQVDLAAWQDSDADDGGGGDGGEVAALP